MTMYKCPICFKEYSESTFEKCECGFANFNAYNSEEELLFQIFKYTKNVFLNRIPYTPSTIEVVYHDEGLDYIDIISPPKGLDLVENKGVVVNGLLGFRYNTKALILNCDYAHPEFLDESRVEILFLGENFKGFIDEPLHLDRIKYLYVHKDNPYFESINNQLIKKSGK